MNPYAVEEHARPNRSCLWGCLGSLAAVAIVLAAVFGYGAWYFYKGFSGDGRIKTVIAALSHDAQAGEVLGKNIKVMEIELSTFNYSNSTDQGGRSGNARYIMKVAGSRGSGEVKADLDVSGHEPKITLMLLIDHEGRTYYLIGTPPPNPMLQNSI